MRRTKFTYRYYDKTKNEYVDKEIFLSGTDLCDLIEEVDEFRQFICGILGDSMVSWECTFGEVV